MVLVLTLVAGILLSVFILLGHPARGDAGLWLLTAIVIVLMIAICIPLAIWHQNARAAGRFLRVPWPTRAANRDSTVEREVPHAVSLRGSFTWSVEEFVRMRTAWLRHTPAGRGHRRRMNVLSAMGVLAGAAACVWLLQGFLMASALLVASAALLALMFSDRIKPTPEMRAKAKVFWELGPEGILLQTEGAKKELPWWSIRAILRTRDGFLIWPSNLLETWLPVKLV